MSEVKEEKLYSSLEFLLFKTKEAEAVAEL